MAVDSRPSISFSQRNAQSFYLLMGIHLAPDAGRPTVSVSSVLAVADRGLQGDRYFNGAGSFSRWPGSGRGISLIEQETIEAVSAEYGIDLSAGRSRRNLVTTGIRLEELNGRKFRIGGALFRGARVCAPCKYLERLVGAGTFESLKGRGGLRADVLETGIIRVGDPILLL